MMQLKALYILFGLINSLDEKKKKIFHYMSECVINYEFTWENLNK